MAHHRPVALRRVLLRADHWASARPDPVGKGIAVLPSVDRKAAGQTAMLPQAVASSARPVVPEHRSDALPKVLRELSVSQCRDLSAELRKWLKVVRVKPVVAPLAPLVQMAVPVEHSKLVEQLGEPPREQQAMQQQPEQPVVPRAILQEAHRLPDAIRERRAQLEHW
jgi:hypothetical protein